MRHSSFALALGASLAATAAGAETCPATTDEENIAIARQWHEEVINKRNPAALATILGETVVHHAAGGYPAEMDRAGVETMMADFLAAFGDLRYDFDQFIADDGFVVQRYTATGTQTGQLGQLAATGRKATWTGINIFRLECGKIVEVWSEVDALTRNRQLTGE